MKKLQDPAPASTPSGAAAAVVAGQSSSLDDRLRESERRFDTLVANLPDVIARFDSRLRHLYVSPAAEHVTGRPASAWVGRTLAETGAPPEVCAMWNAALLEVFETGETRQLDFVLPAADGDRHFDSHLIAERDIGGTVASVLTVTREVTDRRLALETERRARAVAEALREATVVLTRSLDRETVLVTLLERLRGMVPFDRASVMLVDEASRLSVRAIFDGDRVVPLEPESRAEFDASEHPAVNDILRTGAAVLISDARDHPPGILPQDVTSEASWLGVPLFARGTVAGFFSLSKREPGYFSEEHVRVAEAMASQASVAVENAVLFEQMQASSARMQVLSRRLVEAQERERRHIARELHDEAGQALAGLRIGLRLLEREIDAGGSVTERVAELVKRTDAVIDGLHRLAADLRPASLDHLGLDAALRQYARDVAAKFDFEVRFKARGFTAERLPATVETALYRVVQEAMTNVARHAHASHVDILLERDGDRVKVVVEDDGDGFRPDAVPRGDDHVGLLGLRERAEALGGTLTIESAPGAGTTIVVEVASGDSRPHR